MGGLYPFATGARRTAFARSATGLGVVAVLLFSLTLPMTRLAVPVFGPFGITFVRAGFSGLVAVGWLRLTRARFPVAAELRGLGIVCLGTVIGFPLLAAIAMTRVAASHGAVITATVPLLTALIGARLSGERLRRRFLVASVLGTSVVVGFALHRAGSGSFAVADLLLAVGCVVCAWGYAEGGRLARTLGGANVTCWSLVLGLPVSLPGALIALRHGLPAASAGVWGAALDLALVSALAAFFLWNRALASGGIAAVSQTQLLQPFFTMAASALLIGEVVPVSTMACAALVVGSVALGRSGGSVSIGTRDGARVA